MIPKIFTSGDTLNFTESVNNYPPDDGWTLSYVLVNALGTYTVTGTDNGDSNHLISETAENTGSWSAGEYRWQSYVTKTNERYTINSGSISIKPNFADRKIDARGHLEKVIAELELLIEGKSSADVESYSIGDRQISKLPIEDLLKWRSNYKMQLAQLNKEADLQAGIQSSNKVYIRLKV